MDLTHAEALKLLGTVEQELARCREPRRLSTLQAERAYLVGHIKVLERVAMTHRACGAAEED